MLLYKKIEEYFIVSIRNLKCSSSLMSSNIVVDVVKNYDNYLNFHYEIKSSRSTREKDIQLCCRNSSKCRTDLLVCLLSSFSLSTVIIALWILVIPMKNWNVYYNYDFDVRVCIYLYKFNNNNKIIILQTNYSNFLVRIVTKF